MLWLVDVSGLAESGEEVFDIAFVAISFDDTNGFDKPASDVDGYGQSVL